MSDVPDIEDIPTGAVWSGDGPEDSTYRYVLSFALEKERPENGRVVFIMMNPSYANENQWDNSVRRCVGYASDWGYQLVTILNLFAFRTPFPKGGTDKHGNDWPPIWQADDPIGPKNDRHIVSEIINADEIVCAWGNAGEHLKRGQEVLDLLPTNNPTPKALKVNNTGHPSHPLYLPKDLEPTPLNDFDSFQQSDLSYDD